MLEYLLSLLILIGATFTFIGSLGLVRLKDLYMRLHGPTKATTLGVGSLLIASAGYFSIYGNTISLHEVLIALFLVITAPVSAHLVAKAALHLDLSTLAERPKMDVTNPTATHETSTTGTTETRKNNKNIEDVILNQKNKPTDHIQS